MIDDKQRAYLISSLELIDALRDQIPNTDHTLRNFGRIREWLYDAGICMKGIDRVDKCIRLWCDLDEAMNQLDAEIVRVLAWEEEE